MNGYIVTLRFQFPAHDERDGIPFEQVAKSKADAIRYARREADNAGHLCGGKGRVSFKAVEVERHPDTFTETHGPLAIGPL
jgi:hypothetical protein